MNSVHEPGSRTMSKNRLRNSTESNWAKNRLSAPSAQPTGLAACPGRAPCRAPCLPAAPRACLPRARAAQQHSARTPSAPRTACPCRLRPRACRAFAACCACPVPQRLPARSTPPHAPTCAPCAPTPNDRAPARPCRLHLLCASHTPSPAPDCLMLNGQ